MKPHEWPATYDDALNSDDNLIREARYAAATSAQVTKLIAERDTVITLVMHHLGRSRDLEIAVDFSRCIIGSFNICVPVRVTSPRHHEPPRRLFLHCAMPHKLAEFECPGSVDEKTRCEVATYAWMQLHCPDVRIPHLYGHGLFNGCHFTHEAELPLFTRLLRLVRRTLLWLWRPSDMVASLYAPRPSRHRLSTAYMLLEDVNSHDSQMLSNTWQTYCDDTARRQNIFHSVARIMLSLARVPQPRIGSFSFQDDGTITLSNRPLTSAMMILENDGAPRAIPPDRTYSTADAYVSDLLNLHDGPLTTHPNAVFDAESCRAEMACRVTYRAAAHRFVDASQREGPFPLRMDDLHASNIFVDKDWNVTSLVDLEWISAQSAEMLAAPYWLTGCDPGELEEEQLKRFGEVRREFMAAFEAEEKLQSSTGVARLTTAMEDAWSRGATWFWLGLGSVNAMHAVWDQHIRPTLIFSMTFAEEKAISRLWCYESEAFVEKKVAEYEAYCAELEMMYSEGLMPL